MRRRRCKPRLPPRTGSCTLRIGRDRHSRTGTGTDTVVPVLGLKGSWTIESILKSAINDGIVSAENVCGIIIVRNDTRNMNKVNDFCIKLTVKYFLDEY